MNIDAEEEKAPLPPLLKESDITDKMLRKPTKFEIMRRFKSKRSKRKSQILHPTHLTEVSGIWVFLVSANIRIKLRRRIVRFCQMTWTLLLPEKPLVKLQSACFVKLICSRVFNARKLERCEIWWLRTSASRRYKGNRSTRNRPAKFRDF